MGSAGKYCLTFFYFVVKEKPKFFYDVENVYGGNEIVSLKFLEERLRILLVVGC